MEKLKELKPLVNVNVCDNNGLNALLIAIIKCNTKIIDYLLDNGANVNHILDNGLTGLMICVNKYYNSDKFLPNTALKHQDLVCIYAYKFQFYFIILFEAFNEKIIKSDYCFERGSNSNS